MKRHLLKCKDCDVFPELINNILVCPVCGKHSTKNDSIKQSRRSWNDMHREYWKFHYLQKNLIAFEKIMQMNTIHDLVNNENFPCSCLPSFPCPIRKKCALNNHINVTRSGFGNEVLVSMKEHIQKYLNNKKCEKMQEILK